ARVALGPRAAGRDSGADRAAHAPFGKYLAGPGAPDYRAAARLLLEFAPHARPRAAAPTIIAGRMTIRTRVLAPVLALLCSSIAGSALADFELNMPVGVTTTSREVYDLHMLILWVCTVIGLVVYGAMVVAIVRFRKSKGAVAAKFTHNGMIEVIWTVIPAAILVAMAVPAAETLIRMEDTRDSELTIKVTGYQWRWHYDYIDDGVRFFSTLDRESNAARR